ncbi:MAG: hypothetical protein ABJF10_08470 [Chthoniobacter sp.]|uniref:hypothetical protein n=1 Tax=Chthoniobacter sp. TaxID=2510640 RepID=UPI0032A4134E
MKALRVTSGIVLVLLLSLLAAPSLRAAEKGGLLVEISKKTVSNNDKITPNGVGNMSIDHDLSLKVDVKNNSSKELPETPIDSIVLVQRFGSSENPILERFTGTAKLEPLHPAQTGSVQVGQYHLGGHMHGTSDMHADKVLGWKVTIMRDGQKLEFTSSSSFESMDKRARPASTR